MMKKVKEITKGIFEFDGVLATRNSTHGKSFFNEELVIKNKVEYRIFSPDHSKLAASLIKKIKGIKINNEDIILYLGSAHGYTCSFLSDVVDKGAIFAVDSAPKVFFRLLEISKIRKNIIPILADANHPERYFHRVLAADILYQDIAQKNQVEIFIKNMILFLKNGGTAILCVKARGINSLKDPKDIFKDVERELKIKKIRIIDKKTLEPFQKDHCVFLCRKQKPL